MGEHGDTQILKDLFEHERVSGQPMGTSLHRLSPEAAQEAKDGTREIDMNKLCIIHIEPSTS